MEPTEILPNAWFDGKMTDEWGRYYPTSGPTWMMELSGKPCQIMGSDEGRMSIRVFDANWGIQGGLILSCPEEHVEVVGSIE